MLIDKEKYIELRLLLDIDCDEKKEKIVSILNFLNINGFINHLTIIYDINPEDIFEHDNILSLTIYTIDNKMKFKLWNGQSTIRLYHTQDLFDELQAFTSDLELYNKYIAITEIMLKLKKQWVTLIDDIVYQYHFSTDIDITYDIVLVDDNPDYISTISKKISQEINKSNIDMDELKFDIQFSYKNKSCIPCQKKRKSEKDER